MSEKYRLHVEDVKLPKRGCETRKVCMLKEIVSNRKGIALFVAVVFLLLLMLPVIGVGVAQAAAAPLVVVDVGHNWNNGSKDSGAIGIDGTKEADLAMQMGAQVVKELQSRGYRVMTTYPVVDGVSSILTPPNITTWGRAKASNDVKADLFISLHYNKTDSSSACGSLVLYDSTQLELNSERRLEIGTKSCANPALASAVQPKSYQLAQSIRDKFYAITEFNMKGNRSTGLQNQGADVYTYNNAPAVTLEIGFLTNATDLENAKNATKQKRVALAIVEGIDGYFGSVPSKDSSPPAMDKVLGLNATSPSVKTEFVMRARNVIDENSGVKTVKFVVSQVSTGKKITFLGVQDQGTNDWSATFQLSQFGIKPDSYKFIAYAYDNAGNYSRTSTKTIVIEKDAAKPVVGSIAMGQSSPTMASSFPIVAKDVTDNSGIKAVKIQIWHSVDKSLMKTKTAVKNRDGNWEVLFDPAEYAKTPGKYNVKAIAYDAWGNYGTKTVYMDVKAEADADKLKPTMGDLVFETTNPTADSSFTIRAKNVADNSGVKDVKFRVVNMDAAAAKAKSIVAKDQGNGIWQAMFSREELGGYYGRYKVNVYATDSLGNTGIIKSGIVVVKSRLSQTPIMGASQSTVDQMVNYFVSSGRAYPAFYEEAPRSTSLKQFAQLYYDVSVAEGVRPEVAWVQMCHETGFLQFGGDVQKEQFNFAGLGATGGGVRGFDFASTYGNNAEGIRYGIIGHVQHLKCYASQADAVYKNADGTPIDPRWKYVVSKRGSAPNVEDLENNWAAMPGYSVYIYDGLARLLSMPQAAVAEEVPLEAEMAAETVGEQANTDQNMDVDKNEGSAESTKPKDEAADKSEEGQTGEQGQEGGSKQPTETVAPLLDKITEPTSIIEDTE